MLLQRNGITCRLHSSSYDVHRFYKIGLW